MSNTVIHPTAIIERGAHLAPDVTVGAYAYVGSGVTIGAGSRLHHHATVEGNTTLGIRNEIFPYALIGGRTQDKKWNGDEAPVFIGDDNIFREFVTVHTATFADKNTSIGSRNLFCAYAHIGHECTVGNDCVFSNNATLGGHVVVGDHVVIGGLTAVHQFCRIGSGGDGRGMLQAASGCHAACPRRGISGHPPYHQQGRDATTRIFRG
jgi:UDP-N-acetylglucosamine acyltransferase